MIECKLFIHTAGIGTFDLVRYALLNAGVDDRYIVENTRKGKKYISVFVSSPKKASLLKRRIRSLRLKGVFLSAAVLKDEDWKTRWKRYAKPFLITRDIRVVPVWEKKSVVPSDRSIYVDTTFAFGTGLHATTQMMARFIESQAGRFTKFLDIGTGTGILSIIAARYGARLIHAFDIDAPSVKTARYNFQVNRCAVDYCKAMDLAQYKTKERFDFVAANLLTEDLIRFQEKITGFVMPQGVLAVSGIFHENYRYLRRSFKPVGFQCVKISHKKGWYAVLFRKVDR